MNAHQQHRLKVEAADLIREAFLLEAENRKDREIEDWLEAERQTVWKAATEFAMRCGLRVPLMSEVALGERMAMGHSDYSFKWALYVAEQMFVRPSQTT